MQQFILLTGPVASEKTTVARDLAARETINWAELPANAIRIRTDGLRSDDVGMQAFDLISKYPIGIARPRELERQFVASTQSGKDRVCATPLLLVNLSRGAVPAG